MGWQTLGLYAAVIDFAVSTSTDPKIRMERRISHVPRPTAWSYSWTEKITKSSSVKTTSWPEYHFHIDQWIIVYLDRKTELLWWLPEMKCGRPTKDDPYFTVSTDPTLPRPSVPRVKNDPFHSSASGPWFGLCPVRIPKQPIFIEAILWLWMRDLCNGTYLYGLWDTMASLIREQQKKNNHDARIPEYERRVRPRFQQAWEYYCGEVPESVDATWCPGYTFSPCDFGLMKLREEMIANGEFLQEMPDFGFRAVGM
ncbi:hypothetical protein BJX64DRAFT_291507 [Aspergillus heterothallicus]